MYANVIVWDLETVPDLRGFAAANGLAGKTDEEVREAIGDKFPKHIYHSSFVSEPWSLGAYMWFRPGQLESVVQHAASPEGRIHFAGDHTSIWPSAMQGAVQSGSRAASEIARASGAHA